MTVTLASRSVPGPVSAARVLDLRAKTQSVEGQREQLKEAALHHDHAAKAAAERGDIDAAARAILAMLACERRLVGAGLQVVQVIKPRN
jgi:hypothetical protein